MVITGVTMKRKVGWVQREGRQFQKEGGDLAGNEGGQTQYLMHVRGRNRCIKDKHMHLNKGLALTGGMQCRAGNLR